MLDKICSKTLNDLFFKRFKYNIDNIAKIFQIYFVINSKLEYYKKTKNTYDKYLAGLSMVMEKMRKKGSFS